MGPFLAGVIGRKSGALAGFNYSQARRGKGIHWQVEDIAQLIQQPQAFIPDTYMPHAGTASRKIARPSPALSKNNSSPPSSGFTMRTNQRCSISSVEILLQVIAYFNAAMAA